MISQSILIANIGSTSFKYRLFDMSGPTVLAQGRIERIGQAGGACPNYEAALAVCMESARQALQLPDLGSSRHQAYGPENARGLRLQM